MPFIYTTPPKPWVPNPNIRHEMNYQLLPLYIKEELTCLCDVQGKRWCSEDIKFISDLTKNNKHAPLGAWCNLCDKPTRYTVHNAYNTCEGCEKYYVPHPREWPEGREGGKLRHFLCAKCDVPTAKPRRVRRGSIKFS